jgi:hypothetical protein
MGAKPKPKKQKQTDKNQSERFKEAARELSIDNKESNKTFEQAFSRIVAPRPIRK